MTADQLIVELKSRYELAERGSLPLSIHLFGIAYAEELAGHSLSEIAEAATGHRSYGTEIRKGMKIAPHVELK